jgi:hypothetical protein
VNVKVRTSTRNKMWMGLIQLIGGLNKEDWLSLETRAILSVDCLQTQIATFTWLSHPAEFELPSLHSNVSQFLKINLHTQPVTLTNTTHIV